MPAPRINWTDIKQKVGEGEIDSPRLFVLPDGGRELLMSLWRYLTYEATYRGFDYDYSDWDELQSVVHTTLNGLMGGTKMDDLITAIENIDIDLSVVVDAINNIDLHTSCCNTLTTWRMPDGWEGDFPQGSVPEDSDAETSETQATLCDMAHSAHSEIGDFMKNFRDNVGAENPYGEAVEDLDNFALGAPVAGWVYSALTAVMSATFSGFENALDDYWQGIKDDFVCALVNTNNAREFKAWLLGKVRNDASVAVGFYVETLLTGTSFDIIYDGSYVPFPEFVGSTCDCVSVNPPVANGLHFEPAVFGNFHQATQNAGTTTSLGRIVVTPSGTGNPQAFPSVVPPLVTGKSFVGNYWEVVSIGSGTQRFIADVSDTSPLHHLNIVEGDELGMRQSGNTQQDLLDFFSTIDGTAGVGVAQSDIRIGAENNLDNSPIIVHMFHIYI